MMNRKSATRLLLVNWSRFQNVSITLNGSTLLTGVNGSGKSTVLDAMIYLLTGSTQFNKAAKDKDRTVLKYVRGDTNTEGKNRYLRDGQIISYIVMEFESKADGTTTVAGVCIESKDITDSKSYWFVLDNTTIEQMNFISKNDNQLEVHPKNTLVYKGKKMKSTDFMGRDKGIDTIMRRLGLRISDRKIYQNKILKMMSFNPENNIDRFIQESVLDEDNIHSLNDLREQRNNLQELNRLYDNINKSKEMLEGIMSKSIEYEKKHKDYMLRDFALTYQEIKKNEFRIDSNLKEIEALEISKKEYHLQIDKYYQEYNQTFKQKNMLENSEEHRALMERINTLEKEIDDLDLKINQNSQDIDALKTLIKQLKEVEVFIGQHLFQGYVDQHIPFEERVSHFNETKHIIDETLESKRSIYYTKQAQLEKLKNDIIQLEREITKLEANEILPPEQFLKTKEYLEREFHRQGKNVEVAFFADKVKEIKDEAWRKSIETFLGNKRYDILVDVDHIQEAIDLLHQKKEYRGAIVTVDKIQETKLNEGSAASLLDIPNPYARRYANYLLNRIHLCSTTEELHDYPLGGIMKDGMLAKSYRISNMDLSKVKVCLGNRAIRIRLEESKKEKKELEVQKIELEKEIKKINQNITCLAAIDLDSNHYDLDCISHKNENVNKKANNKNQILEIKTGSGFLTISNQIEELEQQCKKLDQLRNKAISNETTCKNSITSKNDQNKVLRQENKELENELRIKVGNRSQLKDEMIQFYYDQVRERNSLDVISKMRVDALNREVRNLENDLMSLQSTYVNFEGLNVPHLGAEHIAYYRSRYNEVVNVQIEEIKERLNHQSAKLEQVFMQDFIQELNEKIRNARDEIDKINRELRNLPFGSDVYRFKLENKPERAQFFRIANNIEENYISGNMYLSSGRNDEQMERDMQEFIEEILSADNEAEYTDYRNYFKYDMEIISKQGSEEYKANLSKKQGSASNGEKQTPYFIILAASLMQCYPRDVNCIRLAFIDEAFSALSKERIEQMVKYFESHDFQVIYAAPPEKINSIGRHIDTTVSLISSGRYTVAVEGVEYAFE